MRTGYQAALLAAILICTMLSTGCLDRGKAGETAYAFQFFILSETSPEWFQKTLDPENTELRDLRPWPEALRITDIIEYGGKVYFAVNKKGVARLHSGRFETIKHEAFTLYTAGMMAENRGNLLCHVFINTFFSPEGAVPPRAPFLNIDTDTMSLSWSVNDFPEKELIGYTMSELRKSGNRWVSAWKKSSPEKTFFRFYSHTDPAGKGAAETDDDSFYTAVRPVKEGALPPYIAENIAALVRSATEKNIVAEIAARSAGNGAVNEYYFSDAGVGSPDRAEKAEKMCLAGSGNGYFISWMGQLYFTDEKGLFLLSGPVKLPLNFTYTSLLSCDGLLYAAWEEQQFFLTGKAGLVVIDEKTIDKIPQ